MRSDMVTAPSATQTTMCSRGANCQRRGMARSHERQQLSRIAHQNGVDLVRAIAALLHHRHDVPEDVAVAVAAEARQPRAVADVVADDDAVEMAVFDQGTNELQPRRI